MQSSRKCTVSECVRVHYGQGFCKLHYERNQKWGNPYSNPRSKVNRFRDPALDWKPVVGFESDYEVSENGDVRNLVTEHLLTPRPHPAGYVKYQLSTRGRYTYASAHRLVAAAFIGPSDLLGRHLDGNPKNNRRSNPAYGTHRDNYVDAVEHGTHGPGAHEPRTHCKHGHEFDEANTHYSYRNGLIRRSCRACARARFHRNRAVSNVS